MIESHPVLSCGYGSQMWGRYRLTLGSESFLPYPFLGIEFLGVVDKMEAYGEAEVFLCDFPCVSGWPCPIGSVWCSWYLSAGVKVSDSDGVLNFLWVAFTSIPVFSVTKASPREADVFPFLSPEVPTSNPCLDWTSHLLGQQLPGHTQSIFVLFSVELGCFYSCWGLQRAGTKCLGTSNSLSSIGTSCSSGLHLL